MFDPLLMWLSDPQFWFIVTAVVVGGIIVRALPYIFWAIVYLLGVLLSVVFFIIGMGIGTVQGIKALIRDRNK